MGRTSSYRAVKRVLNSSRRSSGRKRLALERPWVRAFWADLALPASVLGPVECWAFCWLRTGILVDIWWLLLVLVLTRFESSRWGFVFAVVVGLVFWVIGFGWLGMWVIFRVVNGLGLGDGIWVGFGVGVGVGFG